MTSKKDFDVLVIGAGPAGATAAYLLAIYGFKVAVIEKEQFPRFKLCAGLLTRKTIQLLKNLFNVELTDLVTAGIIENQSRRYGIGDSFGNYLQNKMDYPFHLVDRKAYDALWMEKATDAGAKAFYSQKENSKSTELPGYLFWIYSLGLCLVFSRAPKSNPWALLSEIKSQAIACSRI